jgi:hypothetical protein
MKKQLTILCALVVAAVSSFYFTGCTQTETVNTGSAPTNVMAASLGSSSIGIKWTRDASDASDDTVYVTDQSTGIVVQKLVATSPSSQQIATGLHTATMYDFVVHSVNGNSAKLTWMTANRYTGIKVYEFDANGPSGLNLANGTNVSLQGNTTGAGVDFWLDEDTSSASGLMLKGGQRYDPNWRHSYVNNDQVYASNGTGSALDAAYSSTDFSAFMTQVANSTGTLYNQFAIPATANGSRIITVETADGNLARVELVPNGSSYIYGSGSNRYITVNVSYNPSTHMPYAARPRVHRGYEAPMTVR